MTDDDLHTLLTRQGEAWRAAQPAAPALGAMTGASRAPWLLPALVAAALVVPVVGTVTLLRRHDAAVHRIAAVPSAPSVPAVPVVVPWADLPATGPVSPDRLAARAGADAVPPAGAKPCGADDFAAGSDAAIPVRFPAVAGLDSGGYLLTVRRVGSEACAIGNDTPTVRIVDAAGRGARRGVGSSLPIGYPGSTLLQPGDVVQVPARLCGADTASVELRMAAVPDDPGKIGGAGVAVTIPLPQQSSCRSGGSGTRHQRVLPGGSLATLVRSYAVPSRVRGGQPLDYTLTLTNPTVTAVPLDPCPSYRQALIDVLQHPDRHGVTDTGQLNCAAAPAGVPAHGSITFRLRLDTTGVPAGDRRLVWDWLGSATTDAQGYAEFPTVTVY